MPWLLPQGQCHFLKHMSRHSGSYRIHGVAARGPYPGMAAVLPCSEASKAGVSSLCQVLQMFISDIKCSYFLPSVAAFVCLSSSCSLAVGWLLGTRVWQWGHCPGLVPGPTGRQGTASRSLSHPRSRTICKKELCYLLHLLNCTFPLWHVPESCRIMNCLLPVLFVLPGCEPSFSIMSPRSVL